VNAVRLARRALYDKMLHDWTREERAELARSLERLTTSIDAYVRRA
jgi:DNA-binding MarR family transcriptional regulator